ncbi:MAG: major capsid protein [Gammaproteobacteria bacterium]
MVMPTPFADPAFDVTSLTQALQFLPNNYSRVTDMGLFPERGVATFSFMVEEQTGRLTLLPTAARGAPGLAHGRDTRKIRYLEIPHIPYNADIKPEEIIDVRPFGQETGQSSLPALLAEILQRMKDNHDATKEYMRVRALHGEVRDGDGLLIYNLFAEFEVVQQQWDFNWTNVNFFPRTYATQIARWYEQNSFGANYSGLLCFVSAQWWDAMIEHPHIRDFYLYHAEASDKLRNDQRPSFSFGGLTFTEYTGQFQSRDGTIRKLIADNEGIIFPVGSNFMETVNAPADFNEAHGTSGLPYYAKTRVKDFERGYEIHTQSNPLPIVYRPALLGKIVMS